MPKIIKYTNGYRITWIIWQGNNCRHEADGVKGVDGEIVFLASYKFHFIRVHDNLV